MFPGSSAEVQALMPALVETTGKRWTKIPGHNLEVFSVLKMRVPSLAFRRNGKEIYLHIFCNEFVNPLNAMQQVFAMYVKFNLGKPLFLPEELNWIHSIPLDERGLSQAEILFTYQITHSMFWSIYMDFKLGRVPDR